MSLAASTIGSICGIGGGVVMKPILDSLGVMSPGAVSFLSGCTVLAMAVVSVFRNRRGGELEGRRSVFIGIGAALGGAVGKQIFEALKKWLAKDAGVSAVPSALLLLRILGTMLYMRNKQSIRTRNVRSGAFCVCVGFALGMVSGFLGIGGGPMNLVVLSFFFSMDTKKAAMNSLVIVLLSQAASLSQTLAFGNIPPFAWPTLVLMGTAGICGGLIGARLHKRVDAKHTDALFMGLLFALLFVCAYNAVKALI